MMKLIYLLLLPLIAFSCNAQKNDDKTFDFLTASPATVDQQLGEFVTSAYEDSKGNLWFGTIGKGIARYDGSQLKYFTEADGLPSNRVISVTEDSQGIYWFNTGSGLSRYDGSKFTNFLINEDNFLSNIVSCYFEDSKGMIWVGTWGGVYQFDGNTFKAFHLPYPKVETPINEDTKDWITKITEDAEGNIWFARDGYGICIFDGNSFSHLLKKDGLHSNKVTEIEFDNEGDVWLGTRVSEKDNPDPAKRKGPGGVSKLVNNTMQSFPQINSFNEGDVYEIYRDHEGRIWISTVKNGVYQHHNGEFTHYAVPVSIMDMTQDRHGNMWMAGAGGLYKINNQGEVINVTRKGPWE